MTAKRKIGIFSAGCPSCDVIILDMKDTGVSQRARDLGVRSVPAAAIDGKLADCRSGRGPDEAVLQAAGLGQPLA